MRWFLASIFSFILTACAAAALLSLSPTNSVVDPFIFPSAAPYGTGYTDATGKVQAPTVVPGVSTASFWIISQSNAANFVDTIYTATQPNNVTINRFNGGVYQAQAPLVGASGTMGNWVSNFGDVLIDEGIYERVVTMPLGNNATVISAWAPGGPLNPWLSPVYRRMVGDFATPMFIFIMIGESDAFVCTSQAAMTTGLNALISSLRSIGATAPIFVALESKTFGSPTGCEAAIRAAQAAVVNGRTVFQGADTDTLDNSYRYDTVHWNAAGAAAVAQLWKTVVTNYTGR